MEEGEEIAMTKEEIREKIIEIRHHIHQHPETALEEYETSEYIAQIMEGYGFNVTRGIGKTGVVATLKCGDSDEMVGLRADMDALPIQEQTDLPYKSQVAGKFHGCGHDSHVATMIGAALLLKERQDFNGTVAFIFQPGEEPGVGARAMIEDGLFERFPMKEIYGQHNAVAPLGTISAKVGVAYSSEDDFWITIKGLGGHASAPHKLRDPLVTAAEVILQLQTVISRNLDPQKAGTISCCDIQTDGVLNAVPSTVTIVGDCRAYDPAVQDLIEGRMREIVKHVCEMNGCEWELKYERVFMPLINHEGCVQVVLEAAKALYGEECIITDPPAATFSEDFSLYLNHVPGAFFNVGMVPEGCEGYPLHNNQYTYHDEAILLGSEMFAEIIRRRLPK